MRRVLVVIAVAMLASSGAMAESVTAAASPHNLSSTSDNAKTNVTEVCVFCHTPHQPTAQTRDPLWNHTLSSNGVYGVYDSDTMDATPTDFGGATVNISALCMSCHDGTVAVGSMYKSPTTVTYTAGGDVDGSGIITGGGALVGTDLTNDHPVNFEYVVSAGELQTPTNARLFNDGTDDWVQCASCHDPHDNANGSYLVVSNVNSALCTDCHVK